MKTIYPLLYGLRAKMRIFNALLYVLLACLLLAGCGSACDVAEPVNLRTEYLREPVGIDARSPRFTWEYRGGGERFAEGRTLVRLGMSPKALRPYREGEPLLPHTRYFWNVTVWNAAGTACKTSATASFETAKYAAADWSGKWITDGHDKEFEPAPMFRKAFTLAGGGRKIASARLYVAAAGYYEMFINGRRVGENYLDPGYTHFDKRILYVTHDVTPLLARGGNAIAAVLGNGWFNEQSVGEWGFHTARWRDRPRMMCELRVRYSDGTTAVVASDETWRTSVGPYTYNNIYSGDKYDARLEQSGWTSASFNDEAWLPATVVAQPAEQLAAQQMPGIRITESLPAASMKKFADTLYVFSFAKNIAGLSRLRVKGDAGTRITLKHGERLTPDGRLDQSNVNIYYYPEKPEEFFQTDIFTLRGTGGEECFMPSFAYHGFQYVEVESSAPVSLTRESLTAQFIHTALDSVGSFECSNPLLNKIWRATMQAYRSNLHGIPTDCPQREKNGWTADAHVAVDLGLLGFDGITFYEKWMNDFVDNQREAGNISGIIPSSGWGYWDAVGPVWDAAMFIIPNALYNYYGDVRSIRTLFPAMKRYLGYMKTREADGGFITQGLGDWVYWKATTNNTYTSTAYYYYDHVLMARFAALLGEDAAPYRAKAEQLKALINSRFFNAETDTYAEGTQTAQALALYLGLVPDGREQQVADRLRDAVRANNHFPDFGLLGSKTVPAMLTRYGYVADAMKMITKTEAPSWGYWVETMGLSALPETWSVTPEKCEASLNHVFMGDVSAWMMNQLAGINYDARSPGFRNVLITPHFVDGLDWAKGAYRSVRGLVKSEWKRQGGRVVLTVTVPAGCTAEIRAAGTAETVGSGTHVRTY